MRRMMSVFALFALAAAASVRAAVPQPVSPSGAIQAREPTFKWTSTGASSYTVEITRDQVNQTRLTVAEPRHVPPNPLRTGVYSWRVKEGPLNSTAPWSAPMPFTLLPMKPFLVSPVRYRYAVAPNTPEIRWDNKDPDVDRYQIRLYKDGDLLDTRTVVDKSKAEVSYTWPSVLAVGSYEWSIRAVRKHAQKALTIQSPWTAQAPFSIGVPLASTVVWPAANEVRNVGSYPLMLEWTAADGASMYKVTILRNGTLFERYFGVFNTTMQAVLDWTPGRHSVIVVPINASGEGRPSVPRNFTVRRNMSPGYESVLPGAPARLEWTRSADCTRYRVRLFKLDPAAGVYKLAKEASIQQPLGQPSWKPAAGLLGTGAYKWQVTDFLGDRALYTSTDYFSIGVPGRTDLLKPDGKKIAGLIGLRFAWKKPGGEPTHYQFQAFRAGVLIEDTGWRTPAAFGGGAMLSVLRNYSARGAGAYKWRVRARNAKGVGGWADRSHQIAALGKPAFVNPPNNRIFKTGVTQGIQWTRVKGAARYQIEFWRNGVRVEWNNQPATTDPYELYLWEVLKGKHEIRVRALQVGYGPWSNLLIMTGN